MAFSYAEILDSFPVVTEPIFRSEMFYLARQWARQCPIDRETTYFFSQSGDDSTGDGTEANPWQSIAKANTVSDSNDVALKFKRGDVWRFSDETLDVSGSISSYGDATDPPPRFTARTIQIAASGGSWTNATGDRWTTTQAGVSRLFRADQFFTPLKIAASTAEVEANAGSYYVDGSTVHVNAGAGLDPNDFDWELTPSGIGESTAIVLQGHGARCDGMWCDSQGLDGTLNQSWGVKCLSTDDQVNWVSNCHCYYHPRHPLGSLNGPGGSGGRFLFTGNSYGGVEEGSASQLAVSYSDSGLNESLWIGNECLLGALPTSVSQTLVLGDSLYAHTAGDSPNKIGMFVVLDHLVSQRYAYGCAGIGRAGDTPGDDNDISSLRCVIADSTLEIASGTRERICTSGNIHYNCSIGMKPRDSTHGIEYSPYGWMINCWVYFDLTLISQVWGLINPDSAEFRLNLKLMNNFIYVLNTDSNSKMLFDRDGLFGGTSPATAVNVNNLFVADNTGGSLWLGLANVDSANCSNNAIFGFSNDTSHEGRSFDHVRNRIDLTEPVNFSFRCRPDVRLQGAGTSSAGVSISPIEISDNAAQVSIGPALLLGDEDEYEIFKEVPARLHRRFYKKY